MPRRRYILATNEIYHVFNRSVAGENIFLSSLNLRKAIEIIDYYVYPQELRLSKYKNLTMELKKSYQDSLKSKTPLIDICAFALMPNHYHFLLRQQKDSGIKSFISNFQNSFAKYFNTKNNRNGSLFQNPFKAKRVETEEQLIHISRYIHLNPVTSYLIKFEELSEYPWTSFRNYCQSRGRMVNHSLIMGIFKSKQKYYKFVADQVEYQKSLALIKDLVLE